MVETMLVAASICPHPPILVPNVTAGGPGWLRVLRAGCLASVRRLVESGAERLAVVGAGSVAGRWGGEAGGSLRRFGVAAAFGGPSQVLPLSLTVAAYLLDEVGWEGDREYVSVAKGTSTQDCAAVGCGLVEQGADLALLVMGDGSAKRSRSAPGYLDERAPEFDAAIVAALAAPDPDALLAVDPLLAEQLWVAGREAWQVLAAAARCDAALDLSTWVTSVRYDDAPRGVGYTVVDWSRAPGP
jgi:hypothetical protein